MSDTTRKEVLKPFIKRRAYMEDRIKYGIETNRKAMVSITFLDKENKPLSGIRVKAKQKSHDFKFGANLFMLGGFGSEEENAQFETYFPKLFNCATLPFYWLDLEPEEGKLRFAKDSPKIARRPPPDLCLEYCEANGIMPKAHCLNYAWFNPLWSHGPIQREKALLCKRFRELAERYADRIPDWEVTNETFHGFRSGAHFYDQDDYVEWSFRQADRYFPANRLLINEMQTRVWENVAGFHGNRSPYFMQIERALNMGCRIDAIGMQYHMFFPQEEEIQGTAPYYDPQRIYDVMDTYAKLQRKLKITEMTIPAYSNEPGDEEIQAEILRYVYSMFFSHGSMEGIYTWNLLDGTAHGSEDVYHGGFLRRDFSEKPAYRVLYDLIQKEWHTEAEAESDAFGMATFKAFYGKYDLELTYPDGTVETIEMHLDQDLNSDFECLPRYPAGKTLIYTK